MQRRGVGYRKLRRAAVGALAVLFVAFSATPAWANPPSAPDKPNIAAGDQQVQLSFSPPASDSSIDHYDADCESGTGVSGTGTNTDPSITVTGLTNGATYTCTVTATSSEGTSDPSPASDPAIPATVPDAPDAPTVARGNGQIVVTFTHPGDGGNAITQYEADCTSGNGGTFGSNTTTTITDTSITVSGLDNGFTYSCTITATNGLGSRTSASSGNVVPATVPSQPATPTITAGNARVMVTLGAPAGNGGDAINSYTATCAPTNGGASNFHSGSTSPITVTGLSNGHTYQCTVTATNTVGTSVASTASNSVIPSTVPGAPTIGTVTRGNASISVAYTPGAANGNAIYAYTASCVSTNGGSPANDTEGSGTIVVPGLTNGKTYHCRVTATNDNGTSLPSAYSALVVPATVPHAPTIGAPTIGDASASVAFTPGLDNGSAITSYSASCTSTNGGAPGSHTGTVSPITVTGLTNGSIYTCTVTATNAVGTSAASAPSHTFIDGQPGPPTNVNVIPGSAPGSTGPLKVVFTPGPSNGATITSYNVSCTPTTGGATSSQSGSASPITLTGLTTGKIYVCTVVATNSRGTSFDSVPARGTVGAPAAPVILRALPIKHGLALPFAIPANNGASIINYRARCTSTNGGAPSSPLQIVSPIVATNLTDGKTYTCTVAANNSRGEGAMTLVAPIVVGAPNIPNLGNCSGNSGNVTVSTGMLYTVAKPQTFALSATLGSCSGPYVSAAKMVMSFRSAHAVNCQTALNVTNGGSGTLTWTSPQGMGKSSATVQLVLTSTAGHVTKAHFSGVVTSQGNVFTGNHVSGNLTLDKGLKATASGGDCSSNQALTGFGVSAISLTIS